MLRCTASSSDRSLVREQQPEKTRIAHKGVEPDSQKGVLESLGAECIVSEVHVHLSLTCIHTKSRKPVLLCSS